MKILYLISSLNSGGAQICIPDIYTTLTGLGHDVKILVLEPKDLKTAELLDKLNIPWELLSQKRRSKAYYFFKLLAYLPKHRPDVIWCSLSVASLVGGLAGHILRIPTVSFKHSASLRWYNRLTLKYSRFWIADSQAVADWLTSHSSLTKDQLLVWPFFRVDDSNLKPLSQKKQNLSKEVRLLTVGRLHEVKNYDKLVQALAILRDQSPKIFNLVHLTIVGDGPDRAKIEGIINQLNLADKVTLLGHLDTPQVQEVTDNSDCYIQTSRYEGMCLALHEAMGRGLPAVVTPVGEMPVSVNKETGVVLSSTAPEAIAEGLKKILENPEKLPHMGQAAQKFILDRYSDANFRGHGRKVMQKIAQFVASFPK